MGKSRDGQGTVRQRQDGRYEARYTIGVDIRGKQRQKSVYGKTEQEVLDKLKKLQNQVYNKTYIDNSKVRLGEWVKDWIEIYKKNEIRASSYESMMMYAKKHIYTNDISCLKLVDLKPLHFKQFYNAKMKVLAPASVRKLHNIFKSCLNQAVKDELLNKNPVNAVDPPRLNKVDIQVLTQEEQEIFLNALDGKTLKPFFMLALQTGMRIGEITALKWSWIDFKEMTLTVKGTAKRIITEFDKDFPGVKSKMMLQDPKTKTSERKIPLILSAATMLKRIKQAEQMKVKKLGNKWSDDTNVFKTNTGSMYEAKNINRVLYRVLNQAGLKRLTFHSLRHTFATRMLEYGVDIKSLSEYLGHTKTSFTMDVYGHILPSKKREEIEKISHLFNS